MKANEINLSISVAGQEYAFILSYASRMLILSGVRSQEYALMQLKQWKEKGLLVRPQF
jgi:hypothetical protein